MAEKRVTYKENGATPYELPKAMENALEYGKKKFKASNGRDASSTDVFDLRLTKIMQSEDTGWIFHIAVRFQEDSA